MDADTEKLEREIEASRSRLNATLIKLLDRLHPATVADEVIGISRGSGVGADIYNLAVETVRRSPVPVLLVCSGVAWLVSSTRRGDRDRLGEELSVSVEDFKVSRRRACARIYPASGPLREVRRA